jgi:hypothetical protein
VAACNGGQVTEQIDKMASKNGDMAKLKAAIDEVSTSIFFCHKKKRKRKSIYSK